MLAVQPARRRKGSAGRHGRIAVGRSEEAQRTSKRRFRFQKRRYGTLAATRGGEMHASSARVAARSQRREAKLWQQAERRACRRQSYASYQRAVCLAAKRRPLFAAPSYRQPALAASVVVWRRQYNRTVRSNRAMAYHSRTPTKMRVRAAQRPPSTKGTNKEGSSGIQTPNAKPTAKQTKGR